MRFKERDVKREDGLSFVSSQVSVDFEDSEQRATDPELQNRV